MTDLFMPEKPWQGGPPHSNSTWMMRTGVNNCPAVALATSIGYEKKWRSLKMNIYCLANNSCTFLLWILNISIGSVIVNYGSGTGRSINYGSRRIGIRVCPHFRFGSEIWNWSENFVSLGSKKSLISHDSLRCETPKIWSKNEGKISENYAKKPKRNEN